MTMKNVMFQIRYDIANGIIHQWKKLLLLALVYAIIISEFLVTYTLKKIDMPYSAGDLLLWIFKGIDWITDTQKNIEIPTAYLLPNILIGFIIGNYPFKDINGYGGLVLMRTGKKSVWWISKCIWAILVAAVSYSIMIIEVLLVSLINGRLTLNITQSVGIKVSGYDKAVLENNEQLSKLVIVVVLASFITTIALNLIQILVSQIMGPITGYIVIIAVLVVSIFARSFLIIGNGFMAIRNNLYSVNGGDIRQTILIDILMSLFALTAGYFLLLRMDILKKNDWRI